MRLTHAVTHIRPCDANDAKLAALDPAAAECVALAQRYVTLFCCAAAEPDPYAAPRFESPSPSAGGASPSSRRRASLAPGAPTTNVPEKTSPTPWRSGMRRITRGRDGAGLA